jgi:hypothetical protein
MQAQGIALLVPLTVSVGAVLCTIVIHGLVVTAVVQFVRHEDGSPTRAPASGAMSSSSGW